MSVVAPTPLTHDFPASSVQDALQRPLFEHWTGTLRVFPQRLKIHVLQGVVSAVEGHRPLGQILVQRGALAPADLTRALATSGPLGAAVLSLGLVRGSDLQVALADQARQALLSLHQTPPTFYSFRPQSPWPGPHAGLTLGDLDRLSPQRPVVSDQAVLRLARSAQDVILDRVSWELARWINGRRTLARAAELGDLPLAQARDTALHLLERGLLEPSAIAGLPLIVARLQPATEHRQPPASIRANLLLKHLDGQSDMATLIARLNYPTEEAALMLTGLYREGVLDVVRGQNEMVRLLEEY